jgi:Ni,Fe-hydrogenase I small subunit
VFGAYQGGIDAKPGEKVVFIGDCATWKGMIHGKPVAIENLYKERATLDPHTITSQDIFVKLRTAKAKLGGDVVRLEGCPVSVAEQVLALVNLAGVKNPYYDRENMLTFGRAYLGWKTRVALNKLQRKRYQQNGTFTGRGQAAPELA